MGILVAVTLLASLYALPTVWPGLAPAWGPDARVRLGPPFAPGAHMTLHVDVDAALTERSTADAQYLVDSGVAERVERASADGLAIRSSVTPAVLVDDYLYGYEHVDSEGGLHVFRLKRGPRLELEARVVERTLEVLAERAAERCWQDAVFVRSGSDSIDAYLPDTDVESTRCP